MTELGFVNEVTGQLFTVLISGPKIQGYKTMHNGLPTFIPDISAMRLNPASIVEEWPDLKDESVEVIKSEAIRRFKEHVASFETEQELTDYLMADLEKHGFKLKLINKPGHRAKLVK